jgi:hypothetical protein
MWSALIKSVGSRERPQKFHVKPLREIKWFIFGHNS